MAKGGKSYPQAKDGWYVEPIRATTQLLTVERFEGRIHDPCCGQGHIVQACLKAGHAASGTDLVCRVGDPKPPWLVGCADFLQMRTPAGAHNVIMNPPFLRAKGTEQFIRHALAITAGKVAVFASIGFLAGARRAAGLWKEHPPSRIWFITPRPSCPPGEWLAVEGNDAEGGTDDWAWLVWDEMGARNGEARAGWLT